MARTRAIRIDRAPNLAQVPQIGLLSLCHGQNDADLGGVAQGLRLFNPHRHLAHQGVIQDFAGQSLGEGFHEFDMAALGKLAGLGGERFVIDRVVDRPG